MLAAATSDVTALIEKTEGLDLMAIAANKEVAWWARNWFRGLESEITDIVEAFAFALSIRDLMGFYEHTLDYLEVVKA